MNIEDEILNIRTTLARIEGRLSVVYSLPERVSMRGFDGVPARSMSKSTVTLLPSDERGSASCVYQFCATVRLTIFT